MLLRGLILAALLVSGCTTEGLPLPLPDFGGDGGVLHARPDLALPFQPCGEGWAGAWEVVGAPMRELPLGGDGVTEIDTGVTRDPSGAIVLGSAGGLPGVKGSYRFALNLNCSNQCALRRIGWVVETPPNTWVNTATRVVPLGTRIDEGSGWTAHGAGSYVEVEVKPLNHSVQWSVELFSGANGAGSPSLRWLYACWAPQ